MATTRQSHPKSHATISWNQWGQACCECGAFTSTYYRIDAKRVEYRCAAHAPRRSQDVAAKHQARIAAQDARMPEPLRAVMSGPTSRTLTRDGSATRDHELRVTRPAPVALCVSCGEVLCDDGEDDLDAGICLSCQCD